LVDTYNVLKSGVPNAIRAFKEILLPKGITKCAIRLDSGDITYLSKKARKMLDDAGLTECKIVASNSLDEWLIRDLVVQGAKIDVFGVGERLITSKSSPVFNGVYKLVAVEKNDGTIVPRIKVSESSAKITNPHFKKFYRLYERNSGKAIADQLCVYDETIDDTKPLEIFDPIDTWKRKVVTDFIAKEMHVPIYKGGKLVYKLPSLPEIQKYCAEQVDTLWEEVKRFESPHNYYVDLSQKLWDIKHGLISEVTAPEL
jgi:nicotinate phosphoribosyltransferase